jgi:GNAT superfamily N-acetyltransferase
VAVANGLTTAPAWEKCMLGNHDLRIVKAGMDNLEQCGRILLCSDLGRIYFNTEETVLACLREGLQTDEVYIALDCCNRCLGFIWFVCKGSFHSFPYLHIIAVDEECRGNGIGRKLLQFYEDKVFANYSKTFLTVAEFNPRARKLYESIGYVEVGSIPGLYKNGITEYLMMKTRPDDSPD